MPDLPEGVRTSARVPAIWQAAFAGATLLMAMAVPGLPRVVIAVAALAVVSVIAAGVLARTSGPVGARTVATVGWIQMTIGVALITVPWWGGSTSPLVYGLLVTGLGILLMGAWQARAAWLDTHPGGGRPRARV